MSHPLCSEVNSAMQKLTSINYSTSEQHKDMTKARQDKDMADTCELLEFLESRNPFSENCNLRSIATGINADSKVNVDRARDIVFSCFLSSSSVERSCESLSTCFWLEKS